MGFQFCGFCRRCEQINQFTTVWSNQMTSRSGQEREPPRFVDFGFIACRFGVSQKESNDVFRTAIGGYKRAALKNPQSNLQKSTRMNCCFYAMQLVCRLCASIVL